MTKLEREVEQKLRTSITKRGGWCLKWLCPGWSGVPDRIVLLPGARIYFVETKRPKGGRLSSLQKKWQKWLTGLGFVYRVVWNDDDLQDFLCFVDEGATA